VRRRFLQLRWRDAVTPIRPPWSVESDRFERLCTRCDACVSACPSGILMRGSGGFPEVRFGGSECTFCARCVDACEPHALDRTVAPVWQVEARIGSSCLAMNRVVCRTCGEQCESEAIRFRLAPGGIATPLLDTARCNGCGRCAATCPARAIAMIAAPHEEPAA